MTDTTPRKQPTKKLTLQDYLDCSAAGMTMWQTAEHLGRSLAAVKRMRFMHNIPFAEIGRHRPKRHEGRPHFSVSPEAIQKYEARA